MHAPSQQLPSLSNESLMPAHGVIAINEFGESVEAFIPGELPLTIQVDGMEVVTLMTLGTQPEALTLGYIRNQKLIEDVSLIKSVIVDWDRELVEVTTHAGTGIADWQEKMKRRIVTSGCGQGTIFSCTVDKLYEVKLKTPALKQSEIYTLIKNVSQLNDVYRVSGAVHGCGLCTATNSIMHIEDVGRHNAADAIAGRMWLENLDGADKIFYTTGRLTSEIVMKTAFMGIPTLLSRSGVTNMGLELAQEIGMTIIARAKGRHFMIYNGQEHMEFDAIPAERRVAPPTKGMRDLD
ncbi:formate dehydrogenase accessory sulfurtransferase FdhD [Granulosicoccus antarcticus]|uniref:Sulfur carrier protein FdhD n=1 Tax=Granulosicoccus antarcticus IMCC3135 TaxID=1192854 RepID=A0A2Z2NUW4_9GAMM|nr:formate dehydrogenase accessory sulfurtransferase FdhD [Granulosicoccus antarcticus]ASJ75119.1 Sulfurtransferase FdhD [Granulosicoccus antarcticus IMCC3135]